MFEDDDFDEIMFQMEDVQETECYSDSEKELPYCPCEEPNDQEMINCDGMQCEYEWWHYACAGLTSETIPEGKWICPECRKAKGKKKSTSRKKIDNSRTIRESQIDDCTEKQNQHHKRAQVEKETYPAKELIEEKSLQILHAALNNCMSSPSAQINNSVQERVKKVRGLEATTQKELSLKLVNECWPSVVAGDETIPRSTGFEQICSRFHTTALKPNSSILRMLEICLRGEDSGAVLRLYQLLIFQVMTEILHLRLGDSVMTISGPASETAVPVVLSETEEQALRYACGYIPFSLIKHYKKYPKNEFAIASITALQNWHDLTKNGTDTDDPGESFMSYTKTWLKLIDRGKLFSVSDEAYRFFHATEVVVKQYLNSKNIKKLSKVKNVKEELMATTGKNKAVSDTWEILTSKVNPQVSEHLRLRVLRKFIDMRCNSFCSVYLVCKKLANPDSVSARAEKSLRTQLLYCKKQ